MPNLMFSSSDKATAGGGFRIAYEDLESLERDYLTLYQRIDVADGEAFRGANGEGVAALQQKFERLASSPGVDAYRRLGMGSTLTRGLSTLVDAGRRAKRISNAFKIARSTCEEYERKVRVANDRASGNQGLRSSSFDSPRHAEGFYAAAAAAEAQRIREAEEAAAAAEAAAIAAAKHEEMLDFLATYFPETYADYQQKLHEQEEAAWLEYLKETDPAIYELVMAEKRRQEEARKAAEAAAAALEKELAEGFGASGLGAVGLEGSSLGGSDWASDLGDSDWGGGGGSSLGDLGGGVGGSDFGSVDDWASDLLSDTIDGEELAGAGAALDELASAAADAASATGADAMGDASELVADAGLLGEYGEQLAAFAHAYGMQAAAALGGAAVLYATREQTTEVVARVAEYVSTKAKPFADDVVDQVKGAAKKHKVDLSTTKSHAVGVARYGEAGGLLG